ncbi:hypothetical protein L4Z64_001367 [Pseudomonas aeruginosa]|nr:hypothetical protein [Pseudomonas aeruginosa]MCS8413225.1 hypothetical protein [Pseudomonas aeruginosa]MCS9764155.1 hypothetical protein [Pseudomonas aeruginosa]MCS9820332.1 hypothetical protein [Pseudomonas aeruginosa]MCT0240913.1 hypothetical protein [Pseudomonas aeruginosa]
MSNITLDYSSFDCLAGDLHEYGIKFWYSRKPEAVSAEIKNRVKFGGKMLAVACNLQRSSALECFAAALGFQNWHNLSSHLNRSGDFPNGRAPDDWVEPLKFTLVLLVRNDTEVPLQPKQIAAFEDLGARLAQQAGCSLELVLDTVCAGLSGEQTWAAVKRRNPLNATTPLYRFEVDQLIPGTGRFVVSGACEQLISELDGYYQGPKSPEQLQRAESWINAALVRQPDFLECGLCLAQIYYDQGNLQDAYTTLQKFIKKADQLIPKGYRGKIEWTWITNRFYHRMLWLQMTMFHDADWMRNCLASARKQLHLNPGDNLGVRYIYPLMLIEVGEFEKADKAARFRDESGGHVALVQAFCRFSLGDRPGFIQSITTALFDLPILRRFLLDDDSDLPDGDDGYRGVIPAMNTFTRYAWPAYLAVPGLQAACIDILADPLFQDAENQLRASWRGFWRRGPDSVGTIQGWLELKAKLGASIQERLAAT